MGTEVGECDASMEAMRTAAKSNIYHNPMAVSQTLPALQQKTYLTVKSKGCLDEDGTCNIISTFCDLRLCLHCHCFCDGVCFPTDTLVLESTDPVVVLPSETTVAVTVEVVTSSGAAVVYSLDVPKGNSLLDALELLKGKSVGFT